MKRTFIAIAAAGSLIAGSLGFATAAQAATPEEVSNWIAEVALNNLGLSVEDAGLSAAISGAVHAALEVGIISVAVQDLADENATDPDATEDGVDDVLDEVLEEQQSVWDEIKAAWREGHEQAHSAFAECRELAEGGANLCAHEFRYAMQVNNIAAFQARHEARLLADADTMTDEELAKAEAKLAHHTQIAEARLDRAKAHLEKKTGIVIDDDVDDATAQALSTIEKTDSVKPRGNGHDKSGDKANNGNKDNKGPKGNNGNKGNNGKNGNGNGNNGKGNPNR